MCLSGMYLQNVPGTVSGTPDRTHMCFAAFRSGFPLRSRRKSHGKGSFRTAKAQDFIMVKSMTAYGRASGTASGKEYTVELKSVNNRFLDCTVRLPRAYGYLEEKVRSLIQQNGISRGKLEVCITINVLASEGVSVTLDEAYAESYIAALYRLRDRFGLRDDISVMQAAQNRDLFIIRKPEEDTEKEWEELKPVLQNAVDAFNRMREREGENLKNDLLEKKNRVAALAERIRTLSEHNTEAYRSRLETRLRQTLSGMDVEIDSARILTECAIFADKIAVDEEMVRLNSHFQAFDKAFESNEPIGRRIDFLLQEMNREINTTGSKSGDAEIAQLVVDAKCELEKIREQIQNLE